MIHSIHNLFQIHTIFLVITVGACNSEEYLCDESAYQEMKADCEKVLGKTLKCRTCNTNFCNVQDGDDGSSETSAGGGESGKTNGRPADGKGGKSNNRSDGLDGQMVMVVMGVVAALINLYTGPGHYC